MHQLVWYAHPTRKILHMQFRGHCSIYDIIDGVEQAVDTLNCADTTVDVIVDFSDIVHRIPYRHLPRLVTIASHKYNNLGHVYVRTGNPSYSRPLTRMIARLANMESRLHYLDSLDEIDNYKSTIA